MVQVAMIVLAGGVLFALAVIVTGIDSLYGLGIVGMMMMPIDVSSPPIPIGVMLPRFAPSQGSNSSGGGSIGKSSGIVGTWGGSIIYSPCE